jgi:hypothetical protein
MRRSPRNVTIAFGHVGLTHYGGAFFLHEFLRVLQIRNFLWHRRNSDYSLSQMVLALAWPLILGLDRIETASLLRSNGTFQFLTGLPRFPDPQTLRRFLLGAPESFAVQLHRGREAGGLRRSDDSLGREARGPVALPGHTMARIVILSVAERILERLRRLVYLVAFLAVEIEQCRSEHEGDAPL